MSRKNQRGVALLFVLSAIMIVIILGNLILNFILSQSTLSEHQVNRIRALYATKAAMALAFEKFRTGAWESQPASTTYYCINGPINNVTCAGTPVSDNDIPYNVVITVSGNDSAAYPGSREIMMNTWYPPGD